MRRRILALALLLAGTVMPAFSMTNDTSSILKLIAHTPGWSVDRTVTAPGSFDPKTQPYVKYKDEMFVGGFVSTQYAAMGVLLDSGIQVMSVPLDSGGSGTVFTQLIYAQSYDDKAPYFAGAITSGGHLGIHVLRDAIEAVSPDASLDAPNGAPKGYIIERYTIANRTLKLVARKKVKSI